LTPYGAAFSRKSGRRDFAQKKPSALGE
jgi:hypothetical protein